MDLGPFAQLGTASAILLAGLLICLRKQVRQAADLGVAYLGELVEERRVSNGERRLAAALRLQALVSDEDLAKLLGSWPDGPPP